MRDDFNLFFYLIYIVIPKSFLGEVEVYRKLED